MVDADLKLYDLSLNEIGVLTVPPGGVTPNAGDLLVGDGHRLRVICRVFAEGLGLQVVDATQ
jgi:hypothetical protein